MRKKNNGGGITRIVLKNTMTIVEMRRAYNQALRMEKLAHAIVLGLENRMYAAESEAGKGG